MKPLSPLDLMLDTAATRHPHPDPHEHYATILDGCFAALSLFIIIAYHVSYYSWRWGYKTRGHHRVDLVGQRAREIFVRSLVFGDAGTAEANIVLQAVRNPITAESILATGTTVGATTLINIMLDSQKMEAVRQLGSADPLIGASTLFTPEFKMACAVSLSSLSFFSLAQSLRLYIHFGFFARSAAWVRKHPDEYSEETIEGMYADCCKTCLRAQTFFSLGLRFMYVFLPVIFWLLGSTYFLLGTVAVVVALYNLDHV